MTAFWDFVMCISETSIYFQTTRRYIERVAVVKTEKE
jgi:hypothetical protein